jgi:hypothetical protein
MKTHWNAILLAALTLASAQALVPLGFLVAFPQVHGGVMVPIGR